MSFASLAEELRNGPPSGTLAALPYAAYLGLTYAMADGELLITMPFAETLVGQPYPPRLHGGTVAGLLEITSTFNLTDTSAADTSAADAAVAPLSPPPSALRSVALSSVG